MKSFAGSLISLALLSSVASAEIRPINGIDHIGSLRDAVIREFRQLKSDTSLFRRELVQEIGHLEPVLQFSHELEQASDRVINLVRMGHSGTFELLQTQVGVQNSRALLTIANQESQLSAYPNLKMRYVALQQTAGNALPLFAQYRQSIPKDGSLRGVTFCKAVVYTSLGTPVKFQALSYSYNQAYSEVMSTCGRSQLSCSLEECRQGGQITQ